jgi:uncharacterized protein (TIGR03437 family)
MPSNVAFSRLALGALIATFPAAAWADQSGTVTLKPSTFLNFETGATSVSGGDLLWNGSALMPQGRAGLINLGKYGSRGYKSIALRQASSAHYGSLPIEAGSLVPGDVFGVRTAGGNFAKVIVVGSEGSSLLLEYTTFMTAPAPAGKALPAPVITKVQNNYSFILSGLPNYGIAPGSIFVILGTNLSVDALTPLQVSLPPGLPTTLNQTTVTVNVNGTITTPALYYTSGGAIGAILPSNTPVGNGTITVTYNNVASAAAPIKVVPSAFGIDTLYGTGIGLGVITDSNYNYILLTNSAMPSQSVIVWGSGIGGDTANDDRTFPQSQDNLPSAIQVYVGGVAANVFYHGRSQYPGLDQINLTLPPNVPLGCFDSIVVQTGNFVSNTATIPVSANGGPCTDAVTGLNGTQVQALANKGNAGVKSLVATVNEQTSDNGTVTDAAFALPAALPSAYFGNGYEYVSQGSCIIVPPGQGDLAIQPLNVGALSVTAPNGVFNLSLASGIPQVQLPSKSLTSSPGTYTFTGAAGTDIGSFRAAINVQGPLSPTNKAAYATMTRAQGATVTWSGGFTGGDVEIVGNIGDQYGTVRFFCHAPSAAGQIVVPPSILLAMPAGSGSLDITNLTAPQAITATGLDTGFAVGTVIFKLGVTLK